MNKLLGLGALVIGLCASTTLADRGDRYRGGSHHHGGSRSSFSIGFGFSSGGHYDRSYVNIGYSSGYSHRARHYAPPVYYSPRPVYVARPVYVERPVYVQRPVYVSPPVVYSAPVYSTPVYAAPVCAPTVVYPTRSYYYDSCGTGSSYSVSTRYYYGR
jgi:hypothetical protein